MNGQEIIFREDFSSYTNGTTQGTQANGYWTSNPIDCDDGGLINVPGPNGNQWGVFDSVFVVSDIEGQCCSGSMGGNNLSTVEFTIDISNYCEAAFSMLIYGSGGLECDPSATDPDFQCSTIDNHDQVVVDYVAGPDTLRAAYICGSQGTGGVNVSGISGDSLKIILYISSKEDNEFYALDNVLVSGYKSPQIATPLPVTSCAEYILPAISGLHLSGNQAYYSEPNGQGEIFGAGTRLTHSDTLYLYDKIGDCSDQDTLYVTINPPIQIDTPGDQQACSQFILPPITGNGLSGQQAYYTGPFGTGEELFPGAIIASSQPLYIFDPQRDCQPPVFFNIRIDTPPDVSYLVSAPTCSNASDGRIDLQIDGTAPFIIDWALDNLDGQSQVSGLPAGSYNLTVTDGNNCANNLEINILEPPPLFLNCSVLRPALTPAGNEGIAEVGFSGGTAPFTIEWSGPTDGLLTAAQDDTVEISGLERGEYHVQITDGQGCITSCSFIVSGPPCDLVLQVNELAPSCLNASDGAIFTTVNTSRPPHQIRWDQTQYDDQDTLRDLPAGIYNVTVTDQIGCAVSADIDLTQPQGITLICNQSSPVRTVGGQDGEANILLAGGARPYLLKWIGPVTDSMMVPQAANLNIGGLSSGDYELLVTDANGCETFCHFTIEEPACNMLLFMFIQSPIICHTDSNASINLGVVNARRPFTYEWSAPVPIGNIEDPFNLPAGDYTVTVTDAIGCRDSTRETIISPPPLIFSCEEAQKVSVPGAEDGIVELTVEGGIPSYDFVWKGPGLGGDFVLNGTGLAQIDQLKTGSYDATVTDERGCEQYCRFEITLFTCELSVELEKSDISCIHANDGSARLNIQSNEPPVSINWSVDTLDGRTSAENLSPGDYSVTITDAVGCDSVLAFSILEPSDLLLGCFVNQPIQTVGGREGIVSVFISGGNDPYEIQWVGTEDGSQSVSDEGTISLENLPAGEYTLTLIDANGCTQNCFFRLSDPDCRNFSITLNGNDPSCTGNENGNIQVFIDDQAIGLPHSIVWNLDDREDQIALDNLPAGQYTVTVTNAQRCTLSDTLVLEEPPELSLSCAASQPVSPNGAADGQASLNFSGGTPPYNFFWQGPDLSDRFRLTEAEPILIENLSIGFYEVTLTDGRGCEQHCRFEITDYICELSVALEKSDISCANTDKGSIRLQIQNSTPPLTIDWNVDSLDGKLEATNLPPGNYEVIVSDATSCDTVLSFAILELPGLLLDCSIVQPIQTLGGREGIASVGLSGGVAPYELEWTGPESGIQSISAADTFQLENLPAGEYKLLIIDANNCQQSCTFILTEPDCNNFSIQLTGNDPSCAGSNDGNISLSINDQSIGSPHEIWWNVDNRDDQTILDDLPAGNYTVSVTNAQKCVVQDTILLSEPSMITLVCEAEKPASINGAADGRAGLTFTGGVPPYTIQWAGAGNEEEIAANAGNITLENLLADYYQVTITDARGCFSSCDLTIPEITCTLSFIQEIGNVSCPGDDDGFIELIPLGNIGPVYPDWSQDVFDGQLYLDDLASGSYQVQLQDSVGCEVNIGLFVDEPLPLQITTTSVPPGCPEEANGAIQIDQIAGGMPPYRIELDSRTSPLLDSPPFSFESLAVGSYTLLLRDQNGCESLQTVAVPEASPLIFQLEADKVIFRGQKTTIDLVNINFDPIDIHWTPQTSLSPTNSIPTVAAPPETTTYTVIATHASGCTVTDQIQIGIDNRRRAFVPNAFRPESTENSHFTVFGPSELQLISKMLIYNRWGDLIFEVKDIPPNTPYMGWNGMVNGQAASSGVYVYTIEVTFADGETETLFGEVTLLK